MSGLPSMSRDEARLLLERPAVKRLTREEIAAMTPLTWRCLTPGCGATGTTDAGAAQHTAEKKHVTTTEVRA